MNNPSKPLSAEEKTLIDEADRRYPNKDMDSNIRHSIFIAGGRFVLSLSESKGPLDKVADSIYKETAITFTAEVKPEPENLLFCYRCKKTVSKKEAIAGAIRWECPTCECELIRYTPEVKAEHESNLKNK